MTNYAVLIGNSEFPNETNKKKLANLNCPIADVEGMKTVLTAENSGQFLAEDIKVLINKSSYEVLPEIQRIFKKTKLDDLVLLYYSGHGITDIWGDLYLTTNNTEYDLLDTTGILFADLYKLIKRFKCKKIVIVLDCCFGGAAAKVIDKGDVIAQLQALNNSVKGTFLMAAAGEMQTAVDKNEGSQFSLFTKHFIAGLETGEADKKGSGLISISDLFDYVSEKVRFEHPKQEPAKFFQQKEGDTLILAKSGLDLRKERAEKIRVLLLEFEKQDETIAEIKSEILTIAKIPLSELSATQLQKDELLNELLSFNLSCIVFIRRWDRLLFEIKIAEEKAIQEKLAGEIAAREKAEQERLAREKIEQEIRERERLEGEKAAKEKVERERLARENAAIEKKLAEEKLAREKETQEKIIQSEKKVTTISLQKGQRITLEKEGKGIEKLCVGIRWGTIEKKNWFWRKFHETACLDTSVGLFAENKQLLDVVYFGQLASKYGAIHLVTDDHFGFDNKIFTVDLTRVPANVHHIVFMLNSFRGQDFGDIPFFSIRIYEGTPALVDNTVALADHMVIATFDIANDVMCKGKVSMVMGKLYRYGAAWKFTTFGDATPDSRLEQTLQTVANKYL